MTQEEIKNLIAEDQVEEAIDQLMTLVNAYLLIEKDSDVLKIQHALIINSRKFKDWQKDLNKGILERKEEQTTIAQISTVVLDVVEELPDKFWHNEMPAKTLEKSASNQAVSNSSSIQNPDWDALKNSDIFLNFNQTYGTTYTISQFFEFHTEVVQSFGQIDGKDLMKFIETFAEETSKREENIKVRIPQAINTFVVVHKGEWNREEEFHFLNELYSKFEKVLDIPSLAGLLEKARSTYPMILKNFVFIGGGVFMMGASDEELESEWDEKPSHLVQVSDFYMSKYLVTLDQFKEFILTSGYQTDEAKHGGSTYWTEYGWKEQAGGWLYDVNARIQEDKSHPVIHVSWNDAKAYCDWLSQKLNLLVRLPRESEWEYAYRAGTTTPFYTGTRLSTDLANYNETNLKRTSPVGTYSPNSWGLYDMAGNVWEWCEDWYSETYYAECHKKGLTVDPQGPITGSERVFRGGSWDSDARGCRAADRAMRPADFHGSIVGFRPVISLLLPA